MLRNTSYQQNGDLSMAQGPKKVNWGAVIGIGAALYLLRGIKSKSGQSYVTRPMKIHSSVPVTPASKSNQPYGTGPTAGSVNILKYAVLGGLGIAGCLKLMEGVDFEQLAALRPAQPPKVPPTISPFNLSLPFALTPSPSDLPVAAEAVNAWTSPPDAEWLGLVRYPSVVLVLGKRGSGKSALGYRLLELLRNQAAPYVVGLPVAGRRLLPDWVGCTDHLEDVPTKAIVLLDEAYIEYHARGSMSAKGRSIGELVNLSRQKEQTLIFIVQEARQIDVNVISQADVIAIKELSEISKEFERRELRRFTDQARLAFALAPGNKQPLTWVYSEAAGNVGLVKNQLASFWKPGLSRAFVGDSSNQPVKPTPPRKGAKTPREELVVIAKALRRQGHSYGEIANQLGIGKTTASDYVNEPDPPDPQR